MYAFYLGRNKFGNILYQALPCTLEDIQYNCTVVASVALFSNMVSNGTHYDVCDEITNPFPNFNGISIEVWELIGDFIPHFTGACDQLCMLGLTLFHVSKMGPRASPEIDFKMYTQTDNWFVNVNVLRLVDFVFTFRSDLSVF